MLQSTAAPWAAITFLVLALVPVVHKTTLLPSWNKRRPLPEFRSVVRFHTKDQDDHSLRFLPVFFSFATLHPSTAHRPSPGPLRGLSASLPNHRA